MDRQAVSTLDAPSTSIDVESSAPPEPSNRWLEHGWWPLILWSLGLAMGAGQLSDNSFLTHLATGRVITADGSPHQDVFTFSSGGHPLVVQSWLASWWYSTLESVGGAGAIRIFVAAMTGALLVLLWRLSRPAESLLGRLALVAMAGMVGLLWWNERPQLIAFVALTLCALVVAERWSPWWLVPIFAIWVNCHGSFPLGLLYLGLAVGARVVTRRGVGVRDVAEIGAALIGTVGGALLSPYGSDLLTFPVRMLGRSASLAFITEWRPLALGELSTIVFLVEVVAICALLLLQRSWIRFATAALFVGLALMAVRNVAVASLVLVPIAAPALAGLGTLKVGERVATRRLMLGGAIAGVVVVGWIAATPNYDLSAYPVRAVDWMETQGLAGSPEIRVLTHDYDGNYLQWRYGPKANVWLDDRAELHSLSTVQDYVRLLSDVGDPDVILERNPHDVVIWDAHQSLARDLRNNDRYEVLYRDRQVIVACRRGGNGPC